MTGRPGWPRSGQAGVLLPAPYGHPGGGRGDPLFRSGKHRGAVILSTGYYREPNCSKDGPGWRYDRRIEGLVRVRDFRGLLGTRKQSSKVD